MKCTNILLTIISLSLSSCLSVMQLRGDYSDAPVKSLFRASYDKVWEATIETVTAKNLDVGVIEKQSGLISSFQASYLDHTTYERRKTTQPIHPKAYIITHRPNTANDRQFERVSRPRFTAYYPFDALTGRWKIFVRPVGQNEVEVSVTLGGFEFIPSKTYGNAKYYSEVYSLKVFEREILDGISQRL